MPLPIVTIGLSLAAAGLKVFGGEGKLVEFLSHPVDLLAGHLAAENAEELGERFREWYSRNERLQNKDLEKAVARSAVMADLFCLLDALPFQKESLGPFSQLRERFRKWLPQDSAQGVLSQGEQTVIQFASAQCEQRLKEIEEGIYLPAAIEATRLVLPEQGAEWGRDLAAVALADILRENPELPDRIRTIFLDRWFAYLCLSFQEQIKTAPGLGRLFMMLQTATGFLQVEDIVREEGRLSREEHGEQHAEMLLLIREILRNLQSQREAPSPPDHASRIFAVPFGRSLIQGRDSEIECLRRTLLNDRPRQAILGPSGIGKSQLAIEYAYRYADQYDAVYWCSGKTEDNLVAGWRELSEVLSLFPTEDLAELRDSVRHRLESHSESWLLIVDGIENPASLQSFLPRTGHTHLLITAPDRDLEVLQIRDPLHLEELKPPKAVEFLITRTSRRTTDEAEQEAATTLADEKLGGFPLALEQAGAYIAKTRCSFSNYLTAFNSRQFSLLERGTPLNYGGSLLGALSQTVQRISASPGTLAAAQLLAFLDEDSIPRRFLTAAAAEYDGLNGTNLFPTVRLDPLGFDEILVPLFEFSLIREEISGHGYRMHNMIRLGIRELTAVQIRPALQEAVVLACSTEVADIDPLSQFGPGRESNHGLAAAQLALARDMRSVEAARLFRNVGHRLVLSGEFEPGWLMLTRSSEILSAAYGPRSSQLAPILLIVAVVENALALDHAPDIYSEILQTADPSSQQDLIAVAQNNLAEIYRKQGKLREAGVLLKSTLAIRRKLLGDEHLAIATVYNNLGNLHGSMGLNGNAKMFTLAESHYKRSYEIRKRLLQSPHPLLANSMNNLGWVYTALRWWKKAEPMLKGALEMWEAVYGPEHEEVLTTLKNLARLYHATNRRAEAADLDHRAGRIAKKIQHARKSYAEITMEDS